MIAKPILLEELAPRRKVVTRGHRASILAVTGVALLLIVGKTVGTAGELPTPTQGTAPGSGSDQASTDRSSASGISGPDQANPGQWLIDDVARDRAESEHKRASPKRAPATVATPDAVPPEAGVGSHPADATRTGGDQRVGAETTGSIGRPLASDEHGASSRPKTSLQLDDAPKNCASGPSGQAPEGEHWHYRLDRKTQRKCWYYRGSRQDESRGHRRRSTSADPLDVAWGWWYWQ